jgi:predicted RNA-binding protein with RPS1 domain
MGGEAAKERRRLKRLNDGGGKGGDITSTNAKDNKPTMDSDVASKKRTKVDSGESVETIRQRLQRKMARKASGKFKSQSQSKTIERSMYPEDSRHDKRRSEGTGDDRVAKRPFRSFEGRHDEMTSPRSYSSRGDHTKRYPDYSSDLRKSKDDNVLRRLAKKAFKQVVNVRDAPVNDRASPQYRRKDGNYDQRHANKKKNQQASKPKLNKPKHLKRKIHQLSKTIADGTPKSTETDAISELEGQMKQLSEQMEELKRLKQRQEIHGDKTQADNLEDCGEKDEKEDEDIHQVGKQGSFHGEDDKAMTNSNNEQVISSMSSKPSNGNLSSDEDDNVDLMNTRSRGKRRKVQRDGGHNLRDDNSSDITATNVSESNAVNNPSDDMSGKHNNEVSLVVEGSEVPITAKKTPRNDDKRRCIGRKPVTDYVVGNLYSGRVKYIKPKLGAFIDIGSHSDAFCHISCTSDEFVSNVADILKVDDTLENIRIVEVDREKKRITVSLRSEDVAKGEEQRLKTTRQYEHGMKDCDEHKDDLKTEKELFVDEEARAVANVGTIKHTISPKAAASIGTSSRASISYFTNTSGDLKRERKIARRAERRAQNELQTTGGDFNQVGGTVQSEVISSTSPTGNSGIDHKRERKLARRAERRAAMEAVKGNP